jgi:hypothetical protein
VPLAGIAMFLILARRTRIEETTDQDKSGPAREACQLPSPLREGSLAAGSLEPGFCDSVEESKVRRERTEGNIFPGRQQQH